MEGLVSGFMDQRNQEVARQFALDQQARQREGAVYEALINSPDPEIRAHAIIGLLDSARPAQRKGGIAGWLGEMQQNPALGRIRALIGQPVATQEPTFGLPSSQTSGMIGLPPGQASSMAQPSESPTEAGAGPMTAPSPTPSPQITPQLQTRQAPAPVTGSKTVMKPRPVFESPEEATLRKYQAEEQGHLMGVHAGLVSVGIPPDQAMEATRKYAERRIGGGAAAAPYSSIQGETTDAQGNATPAWGVFDKTAGHYKHPVTGAPMLTFRPRTSTGSKSLGADFEIAAKEAGFASGALVPPEQIQTVELRANAITQARAQSRGMGSGAAQIQTDLNKPIGPTAGALYNVPPTTTLGQLAGQSGITEAEKTKLSSLAAADKSIQEITDLIPQVFPAVEPGIVGRLQSQLALGMQHLGASEDLAQLDAAINLAVVNIARLAGETGRVPIGLITQAKAALAQTTPSLFGGDTRQTAQAKLKIVRDLLDQVRSTAPTSTPTARPGTPPPGAATAAPSAPQPYYQDAQGNWRIR
jgi:hypothetical protein